MSTFGVRHAFIYTTQLGGETGVGKSMQMAKSGGHFEAFLKNLNQCCVYGITVGNVCVVGGLCIYTTQLRLVWGNSMQMASG